MLKDIASYFKSDVGTATTAGVTITTSLVTNLGLINQVLGCISITFGIIACILLARVHYITGRYWQKKIELLVVYSDNESDK